MTTSITTFLTYDHQAEEAAKFYTSIFDGTIQETLRHPSKGANDDGAVVSVVFQILGQTYFALNGGPSFSFSQGVSLMVQVETQAEIDRAWAKLTENGGREVQCGWLVDKFGLSWQIVPVKLRGLLAAKNGERAGRAMQAMMGMKKLDLATLQAAFDGK